MISHGNVPLNSVIPFFFDSFAGATGASITLTGLAITDVEIYKGTSMTQRASDVGVVLLDTDGIDIDTTTGIHGFSIDTGDNSDAGFYAAGSFYTVVVASVTIDGQTVNFVAGTFRLTPAETILGQRIVDVGGWLGTAPATPTVNGVPEVDLTHVAGGTTSVSTMPNNVALILNGVGLLGDLAADGDPTSADTVMGYIKQLINILIGTAGVVTWPAAAAPGNAVSMAEALRAIHDFGAPPTAAVVADAVLDEDMTGHQTQGSLGQAIGDPVADANTIFKAVVTDAAGATIGVDIVEIEGQTDDIGAAGAGLTALGGMSAGMKAEVNAEVVDTLNVDTYAEPGQGTPAATATLVAKIGHVYKSFRNRKTQSTSQFSLYNDDAVTVDAKAAVSDAAGVTEVGEMATGP